MANTIQLYEITHTSPEYKTIGDYVTSFGSPIAGYAHKEEDFVNIKDDNGVSNKDRIFNTYTPFEKKKYASSVAKDLLLKVGTKLIIPADNIERNTLLTQGIEVVSNDVVAFKAKALADIESDVNYVPMGMYVPGQANSGITKEQLPEVSVWIWCRRLSSSQDVNNNVNYEMEGEIFDLTPFISRISTNVSKNGGNFQITLPPLICSLDESGKWIISKSSLQFYKNPKNLSLSEQGYIAEASLYDANNNRNQFLFHNIIGTNDLIFIRYEPLKMETDRLNKNDLSVNKKDIPGKIYDMIGLTDRNGITISSAENDISINITGRDLSKLFIEDGTYFYPIELSEGKLNFAGSSTAKNSLMQRVFSDNALMYFNLWYNNSIEKVFEFVIQQLSTIKVIPDDLLSAYGDKRNTRFDTADAFKGKPLNDQLATFASNAKTAIQIIRKDNGLYYNDQLKALSGDNSLFNDVKKFLQDIRTQKVRKVNSNNKTIGWNAFKWITPDNVSENVNEDQFPSYFNDKLIKFENYTNGIASTTFDDIFVNIDSYLDVQNSTSKYKKEFQKNINTGIWQIIKLVIDKAVTNRRIVDSSASSASGSLLNFFRKVCQEPFVEYYMDTYGDTYNLVVRKPPTDQVGLISLLEGKINTEDGKIVDGTPAVIDIYPEDVIKENLFFDDGDTYSWYHLTPRYNYLGDDSTFNYLYLPALFFQEYADIWGSKPMDLTHNYMPFIPLDASNDKVLDISEKQAVYDLKFMVESNQYNPFVRKGMITLGNGDRRIKIGNLIRFKATGEIFYIDGVQQNYVINENKVDRTTIIQVSNGMIEQLIYGIPVIGNNVNQERDHISYFNIINTDLNLNYIDTEQTVQEQVPNGTRQIQPVNSALNANYPSSYILLNINQNIALLNKYQPDQKSKFIQLINAINTKGYSVIITDTKRSFQQQEVYYGLNKKNAKPGTSKHETGDAIDINIVSSSGKQYFKNTSIAEWNATGIPTLAKSLGFRWGGDFNGYADTVHFEISRNNSAVTTETIYKTVTKTVKGKYLDKANVFKNFKVNQHVFNFFIRNAQFNNSFNSGNIVRTIYKSDVAEKLGESVVITPKSKLMESISTVGISLPEDEKFFSGIGYIAIPADLDRDKYLLDCYQNERVSIHTAHNGFMNRVNISPEDLNFIEFPLDYKKLGSPVYYIIDPINNQPYIIKRYNNVKKLGTNKENQFKIGRIFGDSFVEISGNPQTGFLSIVVNSDNDNAELNISLNNKNNKGNLNIQVLGDLSLSATNNINLVQNESFYSKTFDSDNEETNTEILQQKDKINVNTPSYTINNGKENYVLGQKFKSFLIDLISEISKSTVTTSNGASPLNNAINIANYALKIDDFLSQIGFIDK